MHGDEAVAGVDPWGVGSSARRTARSDSNVRSGSSMAGRWRRGNRAVLAMKATSSASKGSVPALDALGGRDRGKRVTRQQVEHQCLSLETIVGRTEFDDDQVAGDPPDERQSWSVRLAWDDRAEDREAGEATSQFGIELGPAHRRPGRPLGAGESSGAGHGECNDAAAVQ